MTGRSALPLDTGDFERRLAEARGGRVSRLGRSLPCSAWDRWVLVAIHRHAVRQRFVEDVVRERLGGSPNAIATGGAFEHPEHLPGAGPVPGLPQWHYRFHGIGCCLTHADGTTLDVDFDEHGSRSVDPWFFQSFLESKADLGWPEQRLEGVAGDWQGWKASIEPLREAGLLDGDHRVRVSSEAEAWCDAVSGAVERAAGQTPALRAVALAVEDYALAAVLGTDVAEVGALAVEQREDRCRELESRLARRRGAHVSACLRALLAIDTIRARKAALDDIRSGPIDSVSSTSMQLLSADPPREDAAAVLGLLGRLRGTEPPAPYLRCLAALHLLTPFRRGTVPRELREAILGALADDQHASQAHAAFIIYLLDSERGVARMVAGLRSPVPLARIECAAALALVGSLGLEQLRQAETPEASTIVAMLRGEEPPAAPEPRGTTVVSWRGRPKTLYTIRELVNAEHDSLAADYATEFWREHEPTLERWDAS